MSNTFKSPAPRRSFSQSPYQRPSSSRYASDPLDYSSDAGSFIANIENRPIFRAPGAVPPYSYGPTEADDAPLLQPYYRHDTYGQNSSFTSLQHPSFSQDKVTAPLQQSYERNVPSYERSLGNADLNLMARSHGMASVSDEGSFYGYKRGTSMIASSNDIPPPIFMNFQQERAPTPENRTYGAQMQLESGFGSYPARQRRGVYSPVYPESGFVNTDRDVPSPTPSSSPITSAAPSTSTFVKATPSKPSKMKEEADISKDALKRRQNSKTVLMAFSGSTDKTKKWQKAAEIPEKELLFEVIAPLVAVRQGGHRCAKTLLLRDHGKPTQQWDYYEIDRPLPPLHKGEFVRCVGRLVNKHKLQAFSVRTASEQEKSQLGRLGFISQRVINGLEVTAS